MARLQDDRREERRNWLWRLLKRFHWGIRESELSQETGWQRRTVNNYLRELKRDDKAHREGRSWFAK